MIITQPLQIIPVQNPLVFNYRARHVPIKVRVQALSHPQRQRSVKALLGQLGVRFRQKIGKGIAEESLADAAPQLVTERSPETSLHETRIEIRNSNLQCRSHAHLVGVFQDIVYEEGLDVHMQDLVAGVRQSAFPQTTSYHPLRSQELVRAGCGHQQRLLWLIQEVNPVDELPRLVSVQPAEKLSHAVQARGALIVRNHMSHAAHAGQRRLRQPTQPACRRDRAITRVTGEQLIAARAAQGDRRFRARMLRDQVHQIKRRIAERLIEVVHQLEHLCRVGNIDRDFVVFGGEFLGHCAGGLLFVIRFDALSVKDNRKGFHLAWRQLGHQAGKDGRINAPAQEYAERDVTDHLPSHAIGEQLAQLGLGILVGLMIVVLSA